MKYTDLNIQDRQDILRRVQSETGKDLQIIEKDWWVTAVLRALFALPYAQHISFKGGTSLSKCWNIIQRMSEDVDIAIDREFLGFGGQLTRTQISDRLRRAACSFVREKLQFDLAAQLEKDGISPDSFKVTVDITPHLHHRPGNHQSGIHACLRRQPRHPFQGPYRSQRPFLERARGKRPHPLLHR